MPCGGDCISAGREAPPYGFVPLLMPCGEDCISAGREAPPYGLCLFRCFAVGIAFRRDARPRPTVCASFDALRWGLHFGGTRGPALRVVPLLMPCDEDCFSAGRKAPPYGLCDIEYIIHILTNHLSNEKKNLGRRVPSEELLYVVVRSVWNVYCTLGG